MRGCVPDIDLEVHEVVGIRIVEKPTLYELKQRHLQRPVAQPHGRRGLEPRRPGRTPGEEGTLERPCIIRVGGDVRASL